MQIPPFWHSLEQTGTSQSCPSSHQHKHTRWAQCMCHHSDMAHCRLLFYISYQCSHLHKNMYLEMCKSHHLSTVGCKLVKSMRHPCSVVRIHTCAHYYNCPHSDMEGYTRPSHRALPCILLYSCKCQVPHRYRCSHTPGRRLGLYM